MRNVSKRRIRFWIQLVVGATVVTLCAWVGDEVDYHAQRPILVGLRYISGIVFGVVGAWIAIVNPRELRATIRKIPDDLSGASEKMVLFQRLLSAIRYSTAVLIVVLIMTIAEPVAKQSAFLLEHSSFVRRITFSVLGLASAAQLWSILLAVTPSEEYDYLLRQDKQRADHLRSLRPGTPEEKKTSS